MCQGGIRQRLLDRPRKFGHNGSMMKTGCAILALTAALATAAVAQSSDSSSSASSSSSRNNDSRNDSRHNNVHHDQDDARDALRRGQVMPLTAILEIAFKRERGTVLEVELDTEDRVLTYRIELLAESGRKVEMWINARTGSVLKVRYP